MKGKVIAPYARPQFVLFGASMTEFSFCLGGWGAALADLYCRKADILLRGFRGWNTRRALAVLDKMFPKDATMHPEVVVVFFGANDGAFPMPSGCGQHVPLPEFQDNLCRITAHIQGLSERTRVILTTAPPIYEEGRRAWARFQTLTLQFCVKKEWQLIPTMHDEGDVHFKHKTRFGEQAGDYVDRTNERAGQYAAACRAAALKMGAGNIDLWTSIQQVPNWHTECLTDGMHLSAQGSAVMLEELLKVLKHMSWQPSLHYDDMPEDFTEVHKYDYVHPIKENLDIAKVTK